MKTRVTITLDPVVVRRAKTIARSRQTNLSALIEELLVRTSEQAAVASPRFSQKWSGRFTSRVSDGTDTLLDAMKKRYDLE